MILNSYHHEMRPQETVGRFLMGGFPGETYEAAPDANRSTADGNGTGEKASGRCSGHRRQLSGPQT